MKPDDFWSKVDQSDQSGCWPWTGRCVTGRGYGSVRHGGRSHNAHRVAYLFAKGEIPTGQVVRHRCDNPACCNPAHLELGTQKQNVADMYERGRAPDRTGAHHGGAKLTEEQVLAIRRLASDGASERQIATGLELPVSLVHGALRRWRHLDHIAPRPIRPNPAERKTHCPQGHAMAGDNLFVSAKGHRVCRACRAAATKRYLDKRRVRSNDPRPLLIPAFTVIEPKPSFPETNPHEHPTGWPEREDG